jgi:GTP-binding protein
MQYHEAKLLATAADSSQWPKGGLPEIIFAGRSNAGKSSLINALTNRKNLAYSGKTPGKTRLLNFFEVDGRVVFTDAPGYGYANRDSASALMFEKLIDPYFHHREQLKGLVLVADSRRKPNEDDITMVEFGRHAKLSVIVACTKADKLSRSQLLQNMKMIAVALGVNENSLVPCSSLKKQGIDQVWEKIDNMIK